MAERGDYRGIYTVLTEDPDFQELGPDAQLVWFHLKLKLGPSGIDVLDAAEAVLQERTGMPSERVADGIRILSKEGWLIRDRNILWLRNALTFEPSRNLGNENHRKAVSTHLGTLPKRKIVNNFAECYHLPIPFPDLMPPGWHPDTKPITEDGVRSTEDGNNPDATPTRTRKEPPPHESVEGGPELVAWLGDDGADVVKAYLAGDPGNADTVHSIVATWTRGMLVGEIVWGSLGLEERRAALASAMLDMAAERKPYNGARFKAVVETRANALRRKPDAPPSTAKKRQKFPQPTVSKAVAP